MSDRIPLSEVKPQDTPVLEETGTTTTVKQDKPFETRLNFMDYPEYHRFADFFDIGLRDRRDEHIADELSLLYEWGKSQLGVEDPLKIAIACKDLARQIGTREIGPTLVKKLYQWVRLENSRKQIESKMEAIALKEDAEKTPVANPVG